MREAAPTIRVRWTSVIRVLGAALTAARDRRGDDARPELGRAVITAYSPSLPS
jgi:hypothetical protein